MVPGFSKKIGYFQNVFVLIEMKIKILSSALLQRFFDLGIAIKIRQVHTRFIKLPITLLFAKVNFTQDMFSITTHLI